MDFRPRRVKAICSIQFGHTQLESQPRYTLVAIILVDARGAAAVPVRTGGNTPALKAARSSYLSYPPFLSNDLLTLGDWV